MKKYTIRTIDTQNNQKTYRVGKELFENLSKELEPFRSIQMKPKKVKCLETNQIFSCAKEACK